MPSRWLLRITLTSPLRATTCRSPIQTCCAPEPAHHSVELTPVSCRGLPAAVLAVSAQGRPAQEPVAPRPVPVVLAPVLRDWCNRPWVPEQQYSPTTR